MAEVEKMTRLSEELKAELKTKLRDEWANSVSQRQERHTRLLKKDIRISDQVYGAAISALLMSLQLKANDPDAQELEVVEKLQDALGPIKAKKLEDTKKQLSTPLEVAIPEEEFDELFDSAVDINFAKDVTNNGDNTRISSQVIVSVNKEFSERCEADGLKLSERLGDLSKTFMGQRLRRPEARMPDINVKNREQSSSQAAHMVA